MFRTYTARFLNFAMMAGLALGVSPTASAGPITPGYDLFETAAPTFVRLSSLGVPIVDLKGVPFVAGTDIDTIVGRTGSLPAGETGPLEIQLNELFLKSTMPHSYAMGIGLADLYVTRNDFPGTFSIPVYDPLGTAPTGTLTVVTHDDSLGVGGGGTFMSSLPVVVDLIFTKVGGDPFNLSDVLAHQVFDGSDDPLTAVGTWSHTPRFDDPHPLLPSPFSDAGHFYPGVDPITLQKRLTPEEAMLAAHGVLPGQSPEPSSLVMGAMAATVGLVYAGRRRRRAA